MDPVKYLFIKDLDIFRNTKLQSLEGEVRKTTQNRGQYQQPIKHCLHKSMKSLSTLLS